MKGAELPINTLIIVAIAVIVLIAVMVFFSSAYSPAKSSVDLQSAKYSACQTLMSMGCKEMTGNIEVIGFDADKDGKIDSGREPLTADGMTCVNNANANDNLARLCVCYYGSPTEEHCKKTVCGCPS